MRTGACTSTRGGTDPCPDARPERRTERGAAAVEAALLFSVVLVPLMLGVINYGFYFWQAQKAPELDPNIDQSGIVGTYCAGQIPDLLTRVEAAALIAAQNLDSGTDMAVSAGDITATLVSYTPDTLGLVVQVSFSTNVVDALIPYLPLPDDGNLLSSSQVRLQNVKITSGSC